MTKYLPFLKFSFLVAPVLVFSYACTTTTAKDFTITGSNKRDQIVELSLDYPAKQIPEIKAEQPHNLALTHCKQWGYSSVSQSEPLTESCVDLQNTKCVRKRAVIKFQCQ